MQLNRNQAAVAESLMNMGFSESTKSQDAGGLFVRFTFAQMKGAVTNEIIINIRFYTNGLWKEAGAKIVGANDLEALGHKLADVMRLLSLSPGRDLN